VKKTFVLIILVTLFALLAFSSGCEKSKTGDNGNDSVEENRLDGGVTQTDYDVGLVEGYNDGYDQGYADGRQDIYDPVPQVESGLNEDFATGYEEGWLQGYGDGHGDALQETAQGTDELAEVEAAMLAFVKQNSAPGMEFKIENIVINGSEAAGIAVCTSERLESPLVIMKKGASGWYGVDFGTGIEPPEWYQY
jgi:hypothetical protein